MIPRERARMKVKIGFETQEQQARLEEALKKECTPDDYQVERVAERFMELTIQPHLFRDISNILKADKEAYEKVFIEILDQQVTPEEDGEERKEPKH